MGITQTVIREFHLLSHGKASDSEFSDREFYGVEHEGILIVWNANVCNLLIRKFGMYDVCDYLILSCHSIFGFGSQACSSVIRCFRLLIFTWLQVQEFGYV